MWPQLIYLGLTMMGLGVALAKGEGFGSVVHSAFILALLWWGGFFAPLGFAPA